MIDAATVRVPLLHDPIDGGSVLSRKPGGEIEWECPKRVPVEGSYSKRIHIRSVGGNGAGQATHLEMSGCPPKFLQGHNVFGSDDLVALIFDVYILVVGAYGLHPTAEEIQAVMAGNYELVNIDINYSHELPTRNDVRAFIRALEFKAKSRHGRPSSKGGTVYFGKGTARWKIKAYSKGDEINSRKREHRLPPELEQTQIPAWADNKLRVELTLLSKQLKEEGILLARDMTPSKARQLYIEYVGKLQMTDQIALTSEQQMKLPIKLQSAYVHWVNGVDLRAVLTKSTFYRQRKELLEYGIDIALTKERADQTNVIPMIRVLEATPAQIPDWAFKHRLVHPSAA